MFQGDNISVTMLDDQHAELNFNASKGSVNLLNKATHIELGQALSALEQQKNVKGLLVTSGKGVFLVGADITELGDPREASGEIIHSFSVRGNNNFNLLESLPFPTVVAVNGFALGGGFECCLACDYRVVSSTARVGLPEVSLGLIPGWGGSVRLPRLIGFDNAVEWISTGAHQQPAKALKVGAIDAVVEPENLRDEALKILAACVNGDMDYQTRRMQKRSPLQLNATEMTMAASTCRAMVFSKVGENYPAPLIAVDAMIESAGMELEEAIQVEYEGFYKASKTPQCRAMVGIFLNDQYVSATAKETASQATKKIERVTALGAGIMGGGISFQNALKGFPVLMKDINNDSLDLGMSEANKLLSKRVDKGRLTSAAAGEILSKITPTLSYTGIEDSDIVIEAVVENPKVKSIVLSEVEGKIADDAILASNTSTISIDLMAESLQRPENFCGMHFFNPVHAMPLVEVIRGEKTTDETVAAVVQHALSMGKKPIVVNDCPGFLVNRVLFPTVFGFDRMVADGADFQQIDKVMEKWGWPMGPAYLMDVVGLDTAAHCLNIMAEGFPERMGNLCEQSVTTLLFDNERFGQKNNKGFYSYEPDKRGKPAKVVDQAVYELISPLTKERKTFEDDEIIARFMIPLCTEMARCLEEEVVASAAEADMSLIYGLGFPVFRGGAFRWMDELGLAKFCEMADKYADQGALYEPTARMREMAANGETYYN